MVTMNEYSYDTNISNLNLEMKKIGICQSNYIPWKGYFDLIAKVDEFVIYDEVQYTKNDWRNRNIILTGNGPQWITIPVRVENLNQKISETKVFLGNWYQKHINTLTANYSKAPYFKEYKDLIFDSFENQSEFLSEINVRLIKNICKILEINTVIRDSKDLNLDGDRNARLIDACKKINANVYLSGPAAKNYLDESLFSKNNIQIEWMDYSGYRTYNQLHSPFLHTVSIIDLIFNTGPEASQYLKYLK
jgi:hypothetical protein